MNKQYSKHAKDKFIISHDIKGLIISPGPGPGPGDELQSLADNKTYKEEAESKSVPPSVGSPE